MYSKEVLNQNKFKLFLLEDGKSSPQLIFEAFCDCNNSKLDLNYQITIGNSIVDAMTNVLNSAVGQMVGSALFDGQIPVIDIACKGAYGGSNRMKVNVHAYIPITSTYGSVKASINNLFKQVFPSRGTKLEIEDEINKYLDEKREAEKNEALMEDGRVSDGGGYDVLSKLANFFLMYIGDVWVLQLPPVLDPMCKARMRAQIGRQILNEVAVEGIRVSIPPLLQKEAGGGAIPTRIDLDISLSSLRTMNADNFKLT